MDALSENRSALHMLEILRSPAPALAMLGLSVVYAQAQEPGVHTMIVDDRPVLLIHTDGWQLPARSSFGGVDFQISIDQGLRTYEATYQGRTYTAYEDMSRPPRHLAFDTGQRRFRVLDSTISIELHNYDHLDAVVLGQDALWGKAYPQLGFALIRLRPEVNPAQVIERLRVDSRVREAHLHFEDRSRRSMVVPGLDGSSSIPRSVPANAKDSLSSDLYVFATMDVTQPEVTLDVEVHNWGGKRSDLATLRARTFALVPDDSTTDPDDWTFSLVESDEVLVLPIDAKGVPTRLQASLPSHLRQPGRTHYEVFVLYDGAIVQDDTEQLDVGFTGFTLDGLNRIQHVCLESDRTSALGGPDPLLPQQWHLNYVGQSAYSDGGGSIGEDLNMQRVLRDGPSGHEIKVAVVDTGIEICHPELRANAEAGASFNFNALSVRTDSLNDWASRIDSTDPFNFDPTNSHGTAVAGLIGAVADNGVGGRGVAPGALLRGYNALNAIDQLSALIDSLGASSFMPNSTDVDIFNMSFGSDRSRPGNPSPIGEQIFSHGTRHLRSGLGAIYVLAAGNGFNSCRSLVRELNSQIGCISSVGEAEANLPYVIVVGAYNADGKKSSYSSAGANIWVAAPGGEYGIDEPALLSLDQMGWERGFPVVLNQVFGLSAPLDGRSGVNANGDYTALMNGTSAAAPNVSGAIAVLLEQSPGLTWRDVKHVLASTARRIDSGIVAVHETFGATSRTLRLPWTVNAVGYAYHNWYGFGALDLDAAVAFVREYTPDSLGVFRQSGWFETNSPVAIPDEEGLGVSQSLRVSALPTDANIEAVVLEVDIRHTFPNDLGIHLVSPQGTRSVVNQVFNETLAVEDMENLRWQLLSNAFYGENPNGNWQIEVFDAAENDTGFLDAWRLRFHYGHHP